MNLYPHQQRFLDDNPNKALLAFDTGCGKTLSALLYMKKRVPLSFLVVVPKNILNRWQEDTKGMQNILVVTKEQFRDKDMPVCAGVVVDEADFFASTLFVKGRSQMATKLYNYIRDNNIQHVLLLTATPIRSAPHSAHTILSYIQKAPPWKEYHRKQYQLVRRAYSPYPFFEAVPLWRKHAVDMVRGNAYVAGLSDIVDVPEQHFSVVGIKHTKLPDAPWHDNARIIGQEEKLAWIKEYARGKRKVIIVCRYHTQIDFLKKELSKEREVFTLTGKTPDQEQTIRDARASFEDYLIIQAGVGAGFEAPEYSHMVFYSLSFAHRDFVQMKGRILRINALKSNWYTVLNAGKYDSDVWKRIEAGEDYKL